MRATASWPGFLWTTRCVPGSSSCPPGPGTTRTRPTRGFAGMAIPTCLLPTFRPRASARGVRGSWRLWGLRRIAGLRRNYRLPGRPRPPEAFAVGPDGTGIPVECQNYVMCPDLQRLYCVNVVSHAALVFSWSAGEDREVGLLGTFNVPSTAGGWIGSCARLQDKRHDTVLRPRRSRRVTGISAPTGYARLRKDDVDRRRRDQASLTISRTGPRLPSCLPHEPWCPAPLLQSPPCLWIPGQCSAASPRAASSARPTTSQVT